jgi:hypothetical protein
MSASSAPGRATRPSFAALFGDVAGLAARGAHDAEEVAPGRLFGRLEVLEEAEPYRWRGRIARRAWLCRCVCGHLSVVREDSLRQGHTRSCRCLRDDMTGERMTRHGGRARDARTPEYDAWQRLLASAPSGEVAARWRTPGGEGYANFLADLGPRPSPAHRLVRRDPDAAFGPGNCTWSEGVRRRGTPRRRIEVGGQSLTLREAAARCGVEYGVLCRRLQRGWPAERALNQAP